MIRNPAPLKKENIMFIRIGIGKFILDLGNRRKGIDRREGKDRRARHFIMDDEDRRDEEKRRKLTRRGGDPFPENSSSLMDCEDSADDRADDTANNDNDADEPDEPDEQGTRTEGEKSPRSWRK